MVGRGPGATSTRRTLTWTQLPSDFSRLFRAFPLLNGFTTRPAVPSVESETYYGCTKNQRDRHGLA